MRRRLRRMPVACRRSTAWCDPGAPQTAPSVTGRSSHRFTVTIGDDPIAVAAATMEDIAAGGRSSVRSKACQGTAHTTAPASIRSPRTSTCDTALAGAYDACNRSGPHLAAAAGEPSRSGRRHTTHRAGRAAARSRHPGAIRRTSAPARGQTAQPRRRPSAGSAPLLPAAPRASSQSRAVCRCRRSHAPTVSCCCRGSIGSPPAVPPRRARERWSNREGSRAIAPGERRPSQQTADQVQRRRQVHGPQA